MHSFPVLAAFVAVFAGTSMAMPAADANAMAAPVPTTDMPGFGTTPRSDDTPTLVKRITNSCSTDYACQPGDVQNNANFLIGLGTYVIPISKGQFKQVAVTNGCKIWAYGYADSSSYARDYGYGVQNIYSNCASGSNPAGTPGSRPFSGIGAVAGNGNIQISACSGCNF